MAGEVIVDALPYIDHGYDDPGVRESALAMVEEECRRYRPTKNYLDHLPPLNTTAFETKLMAAEFERIQSRQPMETLSMKRYELPPPPAGKLSEVSAWQEAIENSMAQLEHQWVRTVNLELMVDYGIESWKAYLEVFTAMLAKAQAHLQQLKKEIQDVNWQRKQAQTEAGEKLRNLEANWVGLVSKNYEIEEHCAEMEKQLFTIRAQIAEKKKAKQQQVEEEEQKEERKRQQEKEKQQQNAAEEDDSDETDSAETQDGNEAVEEPAAESKSPANDKEQDEPMESEDSSEPQTESNNKTEEQE